MAGFKGQQDITWNRLGKEVYENLCRLGWLVGMSVGGIVFTVTSVGRLRPTM